MCHLKSYCFHSQWLQEDDNVPQYWLNGPPGLRKTNVICCSLGNPTCIRANDDHERQEVLVPQGRFDGLSG